MTKAAIMSRSNTVGASKTPKPDFSPEVMEQLFYWTRDYVSNLIVHTSAPDSSRLSDIASVPVLGAFVSFKKKGRLRSCMGYMLDGV